MFQKICFVLVHICIILFLTIISQIGGLIYIIGIVIWKFLGFKYSIIFSVAIYLFATFILLPNIAPYSGRMALPLSGSLKPRVFITCLLNRHYVNKKAYQELIKVKMQMKKLYPQTSIIYLDANFPFFNGFPLLPHLSHNDGKKLDLAFIYDKNGKASSSTPSLIGYGHFENANKGEINYSNICKKKGFWQYGIIGSIAPIINENDYKLNRQKTIHLINLLLATEQTEKIFIEPHLKEKWGFSNQSKIRFHGCHAVRHDDHIHWQVR